MNRLLDAMATSPAMGLLGETLLHFCWQGAVIAALTAVALAAARRTIPQQRYAIACGGLTLMAIAPVATLAWLISDPAPVLSGLVAIPTVAIEPSWWAPLQTPFAVVWLFGAALAQLRLWFNLARVYRLSHCHIRPAAQCWQETVERLSGRLGLRRRVLVLESTRAPVPAVIGFFRPVILLPTLALTGLTPAQLRSVIAHELAHVRRHDYLVNLIQAFVETLLFYHPAVWWLSNRIRIEREYCCDDVAVGVDGDAACYARALWSLDAIRGDTLVPAVASTGGSLMNRIRRVLGYPPLHRSVTTSWVGSAGVMVAVVVTTTSLAFGMAPKQVKEKPHAHHVFEQVKTGVQEQVKQSPDRGEQLAFTLEVLRGHGETDAANVLRTLSKAGVERQKLMAVLRALEVDDRIIEVVDQPVWLHGFTQRWIGARDREITEAAAAGRLDTAEADRQRYEVRHMLHNLLQSVAGADDKKTRQLLETYGKKHLHRIHIEMAEAVAEGTLSKQDAQLHLQRAQKTLHQALQPIDEFVLRLNKQGGVQTDHSVARLHRIKEQPDVAAAKIHAALVERLTNAGLTDAQRARLLEEAISHARRNGQTAASIAEFLHALLEVREVDSEGRLNEVAEQVKQSLHEHLRHVHEEGDGVEE